MNAPSQLLAADPASRLARAEISAIGGSGFYEFSDDAERVSVTTPYGDPSNDLVVGSIGLP